MQVVSLSRTTDWRSPFDPSVRRACNIVFEQITGIEQECHATWRQPRSLARTPSTPFKGHLRACPRLPVACGYPHATGFSGIPKSLVIANSSLLLSSPHCRILLSEVGHRPLRLTNGCMQCQLSSYDEREARKLGREMAARLGSSLSRWIAMVQCVCCR